MVAPLSTTVTRFGPVVTYLLASHEGEEEAGWAVMMGRFGQLSRNWVALVAEQALPSQGVSLSWHS